MTCTIEKNELVIRIPIAPRVSTSGKSLLVASTGGYTTTTAMHDKKPIKVSVNAIVAKE